MHILQWNVNGYFKRLENIKVLMNQLQPTCICLQETNFTSDYCSSINGYDHFYKNRTNAQRASGGVVIFVKSYTLPQQIHLDTNIEAVAIRVKYPISLTICNIYLPNSNPININDFDDMVKQLPTPCLILGDFNSHHFYWGSNKCDTRGNLIAKWLDENDNILLLNNGQPTHFNTNNGHTSNIDLTLASQDIMSYFEWNALDELYDSDHYPISITSNISYDLSNNMIRLPKKWKFEKADWVKFKEEIDHNVSSLIDISVMASNQINIIVEGFTKIILEAADKYIPKTSGFIRKNNLPWWNDDCKNAVRETKKALKRFKKYARNNPNSNYKIEYKKKRAYCRRLLKESRKNYWQSWVSSINSKTPVGDMWKKIQKLNYRKTQFNNIVLERPDKSFTCDPLETSSLLAKTFATNSSSSNYDDQFIQFKISQESKSNFDTVDNSNPINSEIYLHELLSVLSQLSNSSPGPDNLSNVIIKHLPNSGINYLLRLYNYIWKTQTFPDSWKEALVVPILKPGKIPSTHTSYRPIALTCNLCKIFEKIISKRIRWYLEHNNHLSPFQYGFRQFRSTNDFLMNVENEVLDNFANGYYTVIVSLDIEKAYEMVWKNRVLNLLQDLGIKGNILAFVINFLTNRFIKVRVNDTVSNPVSIENGLPQGSVLSVILFLLAINDVLTCAKNPVKGFLFADDLTIICSGKTIKPTIKLIQNTLNNLQDWSYKSGFKFSNIKSEFIILSKRTKKEFKNITLKLNNNNIKNVNTTKILGMTIDNKMSWITHINKLKSECYKRLNIIKVLSATTFGSDRKCLINTYHALIQQKIDYGSIIYDSAKPRTLRSLNSIQNTALRLCIGAFKTSPTESILVEAGEIPLEIRRKELVIRFAINTLSKPSNQTYKCYTKVSAVDNEYEFHTNLSRPLRIRAAKYIKELNIKIPMPYPKRLLSCGPWKPLKFPINLELAKHAKENTPNYIYKTLFHELKNQYIHSKFFYTDGSVTDGRSGCSVVNDNNSYRYRLPDFFSIFSCEASAILKALDIINAESNIHKYIICTDSKSCLMALQNIENINPLITEIKQKIISLINQQYDFEITWVPSHQGISGNEKADNEAKIATDACNTINTTFKANLDDVYKFVKRKIKSFWDENWKSRNSSKLFSVRNSIFVKPPVLFKCRRDQVVITRLRIGHTNMTHIHLITKGEQNICKCGAVVTVSHLLVECKEYSVEKSTCNLKSTFKDCLSHDGYKETLEYLKMINVYKLI